MVAGWFDSFQLLMGGDCGIKASAMKISSRHCQIGFCSCQCKCHQLLQWRGHKERGVHAKRTSSMLPKMKPDQSQIHKTKPAESYLPDKLPLTT